MISVSLNISEHHFRSIVLLIVVSQLNWVLINTEIYRTCWLVGSGSVRALVSSSISSRELLVEGNMFLIGGFTTFMSRHSLDTPHILLASGRSTFATWEAFIFSSPEASNSKSLVPAVAADSNSFNGANTASHHAELILCAATLYHCVQYLERLSLMK